MLIISLIFILIIFHNHLKNIFNPSCYNEIKISIIMPIYNSKKYLSLTINNVLKQTLKNIEIICIDDGSSDGSIKILKKYKKIDNRLKIIHQSNKGSGIARNEGIKISKGKYISFIDSDDLYPSNKTLSIMYNKAIEQNATIIGGGFKGFVSENEAIRIKENITHFFLNEGLMNYSNYQYEYFYQRFLYNRAFIKEKKIFFPNYLRYQDPPFFIKAMGLAEKIYVLKDITYYYRVSDKDMSFNRKKTEDIFKGLKDCMILAEKMNLDILYYNTLNHLNEDVIIRNAKNNINKKIIFIINEILDNINIDILIRNNFTFIMNDFYKKIKSISHNK